VQRVHYNKPFMDEVILKAKSFYFMPSVALNFISHSGKHLDDAKQLDSWLDSIYSWIAQGD